MNGVQIWQLNDVDGRIPQSERQGDVVYNFQFARKVAKWEELLILLPRPPVAYFNVLDKTSLRDALRKFRQRLETRELYGSEGHDEEPSCERQLRSKVKGQCVSGPTNKQLATQMALLLWYLG